MFTDLASGGILADNKTPTVLPFGVEQLALMSGACNQNDPQQFLEAICSTVPNLKPEELTIGDLLQLAVYHRIAAFPNTPIEINWQCQGLVQVDPETGDIISKEEAVDREDLEPRICGSENNITYANESFPIVKLDNAPELDDDLAIPNATLYPEIVQLSSNPNMIKLVNVASWVKEGETIQDKLEVIGRGTDLDLFDRASKASIQYQHGPSSILKAKCPICGTTAKRRIKIDQTSFFR